jgi:hypothetical protein
MSSKGMTMSAATARVKSNVMVQKISPADARSVGILLAREEAIELARNLLVLATSEDTLGDIVITGHPLQGRVTVLGYKTWRRNADARDQVDMPDPEDAGN